ncbi:ECF RNA polymerase sigma factor SigW [Planctomycetes bacterium Poly30]|uniref:ECF RNA polymerase sigma factor SigW n=1 Tax=Saltatorellus ferox TaxID=2528018 RepID=A0A518ENI9_9BACT|nr:ECF RNA polymerase sigma factor SigW [Planctomycetes bacterium Poly30]
MPSFRLLPRAKKAQAPELEREIPPATSATGVGGKAALMAALEPLHGDAYGWALVCVGGDPERAADALQTSYARILAAEARPTVDSPMRGFLFGVIRLVALEERRRDRRALDLSIRRAAAAPERDEAAEDPVQRVTELEEHGQLRAAFAALPPRQREVLHLTFYQGLSLREAAEILDLHIGSVRQHYERGKEALRQRLTSQPSSTR